MKFDPHVPWLHVQGDGLLLDVYVAPRASHTRIVGLYDQRLKIQLAVPPVEGRANRCLVQFLADRLGIPRVQVDIIGGPTSKRKTVRVMGLSWQKVLLELKPKN